MRIALQIIAIAAVASGLTFEVMAGAHLGFVLITLGALAFGISTKIREELRNGKVSYKQRGKF